MEQQEQEYLRSLLNTIDSNICEATEIMEEAEIEEDMVELMEGLKEHITNYQEKMGYI